MREPQVPRREAPRSRGRGQAAAESQSYDGERRSLKRISGELAAKGYVNERGRPFNPKSVRAMLERK